MQIFFFASSGDRRFWLKMVVQVQGVLQIGISSRNVILLHLKEHGSTCPQTQA